MLCVITGYTHISSAHPSQSIINNFPTAATLSGFDCLQICHAAVATAAAYSLSPSEETFKQILKCLCS